MLKTVGNYYHWLHGQWPSGPIEKLPQVDEAGQTNIEGLFVVGDLRGVPLLKFSSDSGAKAVKTIVSDAKFQKQRAAHAAGDADKPVELAIVGAGVSGFAAALEAKQAGLNFVLIESSRAFSTIANFPNGKPIYTYPSDMRPEGALQFDSSSNSKEKLLASLNQRAEESDINVQIKSVSHILRDSKNLRLVVEDGEDIRALRVIVAIGRSGNFNKLDVPGETAQRVHNRLHDPKEAKDRNVLVVGGGDSALEAAIAMAESGGKVSLCHRRDNFDRAKPENQEKFQQLVSNGQIKLFSNTQITEIGTNSVALKLADGSQHNIDNDIVYSFIGRSMPLEFFRKSGIKINGESRAIGWAALVAFLLAMVALYDWKAYGFFNNLWNSLAFPSASQDTIAGWGDWWQDRVDDRSTLIGTIAMSMNSRSFYYTLLYTSLVGFFGWQRIRRRNTPYITVQTSCLFLIQLIPLFLLPEVFLPWMGYLGFYDQGIGQTIADNLFPSYISAEAMLNQEWPDWGHPRAYWHAYGLILAWPLSVYNVFTPAPMTGWLIIAFIQTFVIIPLLVYKFGKGAYCGWICSCGALAETLGDTQRHKMPRGPRINKLNMIGQVLLAIAFALLALRIFGWIFPDSGANSTFNLLLFGTNADNQIVNPLSWKWTVDILFGGIIGVGLYFKYSGRVWCRFICPLAALMNIYARFSRFRIFADKSKCISCNACSSVCHQGIDIMNFANKGEAMADPQCVRCSACVQSCPTGVLQFGEIDFNTGKPAKLDRLAASPVRIIES